MAFLSDFAARGAASTPNSRRGLFVRVRDALKFSRQDEMDEFATRYLETSGGVLTDHAEREIERRFMSRSFH